MRKKLLLLSICLSSIFCARQNASITEEELVVNQLLSNIINAGNPNALDKIVFSRSQADGSFITQINATNLDFYIYFQFEGNRQIPFSDKDGRTWDVAFNRYKLATNSGETNRFGSGGACKSNRGSVADASSVTPENQNCPSGNFITDRNATTTGIGGVGATFIGNPLLTDWFNYEIGSLTTKGEIYIIRAGTGNSHYAMRMENYYSDAGTSGYPTIRWKKLP